MEIHSPGSLYGRMTVEQLGYARPDLRNPALAVMAEGLVGAENRYSGIPTIRREMAAHGLPEPVFENRRNEFVVTLYNQKFRFGIQRKSSDTEGTERSPGGCVQYRVAAGILPDAAVQKGDHPVPRTETAGYAMERYIRPLLAQGKLR